MASLMLDHKCATKDKYAGFSNQIRLPQNLIYGNYYPWVLGRFNI